MGQFAARASGLARASWLQTESSSCAKSAASSAFEKMYLLPAMASLTRGFAMADIIKQTALLDALTEKQRQVIAFVSDGMTSKEIGRRLGISESAVNQRIETVRARLDGMSRAQIARLYRGQSTLVITIPTNNSLTGKPIQLQAGSNDAQPSATEGAATFPERVSDEKSSVLQPSTFSPFAQNQTSPLVRLGAIVGLALGLAALTVLVLVAAEAIDRLLGSAS